MADKFKTTITIEKELYNQFKDECKKHFLNPTLLVTNYVKNSLEKLLNGTFEPGENKNGTFEPGENKRWIYVFNHRERYNRVNR